MRDRWARNKQKRWQSKRHPCCQACRKWGTRPQLCAPNIPTEWSSLDPVVDRNPRHLVCIDESRLERFLPRKVSSPRIKFGLQSMNAGVHSRRWNESCCAGCVYVSNKLACRCAARRLRLVVSIFRCLSTSWSRVLHKDTIARREQLSARGCTLYAAASPGQTQSLLVSRAWVTGLLSGKASA